MWHVLTVYLLNEFIHHYYYYYYYCIIRSLYRLAAETKLGFDFFTFRSESMGE